jgi:hypothetical protein
MACDSQGGRMGGVQGWVGGGAVAWRNSFPPLLSLGQAQILYWYAVHTFFSCRFVKKKPPQHNQNCPVINTETRFNAWPYRAARSASEGCCCRS